MRSVRKRRSALPTPSPRLGGRQASLSRHGLAHLEEAVEHLTLVMSLRLRGPFHVTIEWCESRLASPMPVGLTRGSSHRLWEALTAAGTVMTIATFRTWRACGIHRGKHKARPHVVGDRRRVESVTMKSWSPSGSSMSALQGMICRSGVVLVELSGKPLIAPSRLSIRGSLSAAEVFVSGALALGMLPSAPQETPCSWTLSICQSCCRP